MVDLYEHNQQAYESAMALLAETGKAAIVHPTGTGKSFIAFKLCEAHPDKKICWLSPSNYIFRTQMENRQRAGGEELKNIVFFTYARLMGLQQEVIDQIHPDCIILDEFHRVGADFWGLGVEHLLKAYPDVPVLGLSATAIRYLDHNRNMVDELFDGHLASHITLGEAVVRGILEPPKYVLTLFSSQNELKRYERRVAKNGSARVRDEAQVYLEALRRKLEKADGLDVIFKKHMPDTRGKYIVFCANYEHMTAMMDETKDWFEQLDPHPHVYSVYASDPGSGQSFMDFKEDKDGSHLRLLYCIDALNEGIHVKELDGVILLRPTVSPIVYKQQIGRAMASGSGKATVIFDIVDNISGLYSIDAIQDEMDEAMHYFVGTGEPEEIVNERFKVIDEVRDCRELFKALDETLSASWDLMYLKAKAYYEANGDLLVPKSYVTEEGYALGTWIANQRRMIPDQACGTIYEDRIKKLTAIGMVWGELNTLIRDQYYQAAKAYYEKNGDLLVPANFVTEEGLRLGNWIRNCRSLRKGEKKGLLSDEEIRALDAIGMIWDVNEHVWQRYYRACKDYAGKYGDLNVSPDYITEDHLMLGNWLDRMRYAYHGTPSFGLKITPEQIDALNAMGMNWHLRTKQRWQKGYEKARAYYQAHGDLDCPNNYVTEDGFALGQWLSRQRCAKNMPEDRNALLKAIGMCWSKPDSWTVYYEAARDWYEAHDDLNVPSRTVVGKLWLGKWVKEQKMIYAGKRKGKVLSAEQIEKLNAIGMVWEDKATVLWNEQFDEAKRYYEAHGDLRIPKDYKGQNGKGLSAWLTHQRKAYKNAQLSEERVRRLRSIGMVFEDPWEIGFAHASEYYRAHGDLLVPNDFVCEDGYKLGLWLRNQTAIYNGKMADRHLSEEKIRRLEAIGMVWNKVQYQWDVGYAHLKTYLEGNSELPGSHFVTSDGYKLGSWIRTQRLAFENGKMSPERLRRLNEAGYALG